MFFKIKSFQITFLKNCTSGYARIYRTFVKISGKIVTYMNFKELKLNKHLLRAVAEKNYDDPTAIQEIAIPLVLQKNDIIASAETGTGKTAAFALPILQLL